jgi:hypothetical protein
MTRSLTRTHFHSSRLTRTLAGMGALGAADPGNAFAEQLGLWVDFKGAITLSSVHNAPIAGPVNARSGGSPGTTASIAQEFARTRAALESAIATSGTPGAGGTRTALPTPAPGASVEESRAYAPYRRYHQAIQRDLETKVGALRARVRESVAQVSPTLRQLAALDGAFDSILCEREARLLSTVPSLLERRFQQLLQAHQQTLADSQQADSVDRWMAPGAWLARFCGELHSVLLAELDLRLQPSLGLLDALHHETSQHL